MQEMLLQFIWQYSLYNSSALRTTAGEEVTVLYPGRLNRDAGPDFLEARVKVGRTTLVGNLEIHIQSSDWRKHGHTRDPAYQNIILHVVYKNDQPEPDGSFPVLELGPHIPAYVVDQYTHLIQTTQPIACARQIGSVKALTKENWLSRLLAERWEAKLKDWKELLDESAGDWRNLLYWRMAANFGFKVNAAPFLLLAKSLPLNILARHKESLLQTEALLFGQAGMLEGAFQDEHPLRLQQEYQYLRKKYGLVPVQGHLWRFMRMRPANFPSVRIAQFAALIHHSVHLFSRTISSGTIEEVRGLLTVKAGEYWNDRYRFDEPQKRSYPKILGPDSIDNIIINTLAPIQFLYAWHQGNVKEQERALQLIAAVDPENNSYTRLWEEQGWKPGNAADSQALLQLFHHYCAPKKCLDCAIGLSIIRSVPVE